MTKTPRLTQPRRWTGLALASVTLAATPVLAEMPRPITLATPDAQLWLVDAQGGEGGEAGVSSDAAPDAAYLAELTIVLGHMQAARDLYAMGQEDLAIELSKHPQEEGTLDELRKEIADHKAADVADVVAAFTAAMEKGAAQADVDAALAAISTAFAAAASVEGDQTRTRFDAVVLVLKAAAEEYQGSIKDGKVEDVMAWHEAWSFIALAKAELQALSSAEKAAKAAPKALKALAEVDAAFGDPMAAEPLAGDGQILLEVAAKVELIASSVR